MAAGQRQIGKEYPRPDSLFYPLKDSKLCIVITFGGSRIIKAPKRFELPELCRTAPGSYTVLAA